MHNIKYTIYISDEGKYVPKYHFRELSAGARQYDYKDILIPELPTEIL